MSRPSPAEPASPASRDLIPGNLLATSAARKVGARTIPTTRTCARPAGASAIRASSPAAAAASAPRANVR